MFPSVRANIVDYLRGVFLKDKKRWVSGKAIEDLDRFKRHKTSNVSRRCRELAEDGLIERYLEKRGRYKFVAYRYLEPKNESIVWKKDRRKTQDRKVKQLTH